MTVRWDAAADPALVESRKAPAAFRHPAPPGTADSIRIRVRLFGALAALSAQQAAECVLPAGTTVTDVIETLGERLGETFLAHVADANGVKHRHCRLFVSGFPIEDLSTPLYATDQLTEIDIILLIAPEGG